MSYNTPQELSVIASDTGVAKANLTPDKQFVSAILAGAFIAFGSLLAVAVTGGLDPKIWGTLNTLFYGLTFSLGLILVVLLGVELVTGNMGLVPLAFIERRISGAKAVRSIVIATAGNLVGSLFVAYVFAVKTGVIGKPTGSEPSHLVYERLAAVAKTKAVTETGLDIFLRAIACNWLVLLAILLAYSATNVSGKILGIIFPITAFVAMGFDHVVANFFFLPAAMFAHVPGITASHVIPDLLLAFAGNLIGGVVFVAGTTYYLNLRGRPIPAQGA